MSTRASGGLPSSPNPLSTLHPGGVGSSDPAVDEREGRIREVGAKAVWALSSCKPGQGVDQLRDGTTETYWQSDGPQPHLVNISFREKTTIKEVCIYTDYKADESYTPNKISIKAGTNYSDLQEVESVELNEPSGWVRLTLADARDRPIRCFLVQIAILANHQNGRDTHIRQIRVYAPGNVPTNSDYINTTNFTSVELQSVATIR